MFVVLVKTIQYCVGYETNTIIVSPRRKKNEIGRPGSIIIGGARGIGEAIAHTFSKEGASLVLVDLEKMKTQLDGVVLSINQQGGKAVAIAADCSDDRQVNALVDETVHRFGKIDVLVNSAGFRGPLVPVTEISEKEFDDVILYNLKLVFLCCRAVLKQMEKQKSGSIVSISGTAGREGMAMRGSLCAAKWGVVGLTQTIAKEYGPYGIRANIICPGGMDEPDLREMYAERAKNLGMSFKAVGKPNPRADTAAQVCEARRSR